MDSVTGRVENNSVGLFLNGIENLENISGKERAVGQTIPFGIDFGGLDGLFHYLDADHFFGRGCHELGYGSGSAVEVIDNSFFFSCHCPFGKILPGRIIEDFRPVAVGLEKGKRCYFKTKPQQFLRKEILSVQDFRTLVCNDIR